MAANRNRAETEGRAVYGQMLTLSYITLRAGGGRELGDEAGPDLVHAHTAKLRTEIYGFFILYSPTLILVPGSQVSRI
jgi:hypothetical protein